MVHTSPLDQPGIGDAGGMNIYVVEAAQRMAAMGVEVDIFTRRTNAEQPEIVEFSKGVRVRHFACGHGALTKEELPAHINGLSKEFLRIIKEENYDVIHSHYWISGKVGMPASKELGIPLVHTMHTMARVKNLNLAEGESPEPMIRVQGETQVVAAAQALIANTDAEAASLVSLYDACPDIVHVVTPGVDLYTFIPGAGKVAAREFVGIDADALVVSFVGRIQPHKGPEVLIRATSELVKRYGATRRKHPLSSATVSVEEAILKERSLLEQVKGSADLVIDTSSLNVHQLKSQIQDLFAAVGGKDVMQLTVESFGYKHGIPLDVDLVFDVRFLPNPHWDENLRPLSGLDQAVSDFVLQQPLAIDFVDKIDALFGMLIPAYRAEGKSYLTVAIGCTGGRHRSVAIAEEIGRKFIQFGHHPRVIHRDIAR